MSSDIVDSLLHLLVAIIMLVMIDIVSSVTATSGLLVVLLKISLLPILNSQVRSCILVHPGSIVVKIGVFPRW